MQHNTLASHTVILKLRGLGRSASLVAVDFDILRKISKVKNDFNWDGLADTELLDVVFNAAPNGIAVLKCIKNEQGHIHDFSVLLLNAAILDRVGLDLSYKGKLCSELIPEVAKSSLFDKLIKAAEGAATHRFVYEHRHGAEKSSFRFNIVKKEELLIVTIEDTSEISLADETLQRALQEAEKQRRLYDSITGSVPDLIYVFDLEYRFTYANKALLEMWGKSAEEAIGKGLRENGYEEWHALMHEGEIDAVVSTKLPIRGTVSFPHATQGTRVYDYIFVPVINENGEVEAVAGSTRDITEIKLAQSKLEESEKHFKHLSATLEQQVADRTEALQRSNADLQKFAHVASHDLKEPLRKVKTFLSRLEERIAGQLDPECERYLQRIHVSADRMFTMIDGVLEHSKVNANKHSLYEVDLNEVLADVESEVEIVLAEKRGKLAWSRLPKIEGVKVLIYQLFYNLIYNSLKFSKANVPPEINISSSVETVQGKRYVCVTVSDNGIGFEASDAQKIFETFTRLNSKDEYEGTGLGLSLCKKIAEQHGGSVKAEGKLGEGATFFVTLPKYQ